MKKLLLVPIVAALASPLAALAESNVNLNAGPSTATAKLDFRITVPRVLFLQVGTGSSLAADATVNLIDFQVPANNVASGTAVAATTGSGDQGNGSVTVRVLANGVGTGATGNVQLKSTTSGAMGNGVAGQTIDWDQIDVVASNVTTPTAGYSGGTINHPAFKAGGGDSVTPVTLGGTNGVVRQEGKWTYSYKNQNVVAAGTYGGVNSNNGRVTYTATSP
jgi:hypothetical protein